MNSAQKKEAQGKPLVGSDDDAVLLERLAWDILQARNLKSFSISATAAAAAAAAAICQGQNNVWAVQSYET